MIDLRPYQKKALMLIQSGFRKGHKKVLLHMATGLGKTVVFCEALRATSFANKHPSMMLVRGRKLVSQASERLDREGTHHQVKMANFKHFQTGGEKISICSIDTLMAREEFPPAKLIVLDEADLFKSDLFKEFLSHYPESYILAVTATPWIKGSLTHIADTIVHPISFTEATEQGYLAPLTVYWPEQCQPDVSNVNVSQATGDYVADELAEATLKEGITGSIIEHYYKLDLYERPTLLFAVNVKHSKILTDRFNEEGIPAMHIDANTPDVERESAIDALEHGRLKVICNVKVMERGVDMPFLKAIIFARKTKSRNTYIQQIGRGTRPCDGKSDCLVLDFVGNVWEHDLPDFEPPVILDPMHRPEERHQSRLKTCPKCYAVFTNPYCPCCGAQARSHNEGKKMEEHDGNLVKFKPGDSIPARLKKLQIRAKENGYKHTWCYFKLADRYGIEAVISYVPKWFVRIYLQSKKEERKPSKEIDIDPHQDGGSYDSEYEELNPEEDLSW